MKKYKKAYSREGVIRRLWSVHMIIRVHKLVTTIMAKDLSCSICNDLELAHNYNII